MTASVFVIIIFAAALHAAWNAIVKAAHDPQLSTVLVTASAAFIAILILPFLPVPDRGSWPFIGASTILQIAYFLLLSRAYRHADMSAAYPLMRGVAPLLVAALSATIFGEPLTLAAWAGIAAISGGVILIAAVRHRVGGRAIVLALLTSVTIAAYTLVDGAGVRRSGAPLSYTLWLFLLTGVMLTAWTVAKRRSEFRGFVASHWRLGVAGGASSIASYGLALWAMTVAPVAIIAAMRETSILFAVAISAFFLGEQPRLNRIAGAILIAGGAALLRIA